MNTPLPWQERNRAKKRLYNWQKRKAREHSIMEISNTTSALEQLTRMEIAINNAMAELKKVKSQIYEMQQSFNALNRLRSMAEHDAS